MKLTFNSQEIEQALIDFVSNQGINLSDKEVSVNMTAGRGVNGYSAELNIVTKQHAGSKSDSKVIEGEMTVSILASDEETVSESEIKDTDSVFG